MADSRTYALEARGVSKEEADEVTRSLTAEGAVGRCDDRGYFALDADYRYEEEDRTACFGSLDEVEWPEAEGEIASISRRYPEAVFALEGRGYDENRTYFKGGLSYTVYPECVYPGFDEARLG